jgi:hypothetical protein
VARAKFVGGTAVQFPEMEALRKALREFPSNIAAKHLGAALRKGSKPAQDTLKQEVRNNHRGPTGNLLRSVTTLVKTYKKTGNAVALVGFTKAGSGKTRATGGTVQKGKDRAFHAGFIEFGTKPRRTKNGTIASSYKKLGPFKIKPIAKRGKFAGVVRVQTIPKLPKAFFKKGQGGQGAYLGQVQASKPIVTTLNKSKGSVRNALKAGLEQAITKAGKDLANSFPVKRGGGDVGPLPF